MPKQSGLKPDPNFFVLISSYCPNMDVLLQESSEERAQCKVKKKTIFINFDPRLRGLEYTLQILVICLFPNYYCTHYTVISFLLFFLNSPAFTPPPTPLLMAWL